MEYPVIHDAHWYIVQVYPGPACEIHIQFWKVDGFYIFCSLGKHAVNGDLLYIDRWARWILDVHLF